MAFISYRYLQVAVPCLKQSRFSPLLVLAHVKYLQVLIFLWACLRQALNFQHLTFSLPYPFLYLPQGIPVLPQHFILLRHGYASISQKNLILPGPVEGYFHLYLSELCFSHKNSIQFLYIEDLLLGSYAHCFSSLISVLANFSQGCVLCSVLPSLHVTLPSCLTVASTRQRYISITLLSSRSTQLIFLSVLYPPQLKIARLYLVNRSLPTSSESLESFGILPSLPRL